MTVPKDPERATDDIYKDIAERVTAERDELRKAFTDLRRKVIAECAEWLRSDMAEAVRQRAMFDDIPPEDALAYALEADQMHDEPAVPDGN